MAEAGSHSGLREWSPPQLDTFIQQFSCTCWAMVNKINTALPSAPSLHTSSVDCGTVYRTAFLNKLHPIMLTSSQVLLPPAPRALRSTTSFHSQILATRFLPEPLPAMYFDHTHSDLQSNSTFPLLTVLGDNILFATFEPANWLVSIW